MIRIILNGHPANDHGIGCPVMNLSDDEAQQLYGELSKRELRRRMERSSEAAQNRTIGEQMTERAEARKRAIGDADMPPTNSSLNGQFRNRFGDRAMQQCADEAQSSLSPARYSGVVTRTELKPKAGLLAQGVLGMPPLRWRDGTLEWQGGNGQWRAVPDAT